MTEEYAASWKSIYPSRREEARQTRNGVLANPNNVGAMEVDPARRQKMFEERWESGGTTFMAVFNDLIFSQDSNDQAAEFVRNQIRATVNDPATAELLAPKNHPIGTKRICVDTDYYQTFNLPHVHLVDVRQAPIEAITPGGLLSGGREYGFDTLVYATGFDAMTGAMTAVDITGRDGLKLKDEWEAGPRTYLGLMCAGFPNLFMITGPGSPSVLSNMMVSIEQHVDWVTDCVTHLAGRQMDCIEPTREAQDGWVAHVNTVAHTTLYPKAASWYMGANIEGKPRVFMPYIGGVGTYRRECDEIVAAGYKGFLISAAAAPRAQAAE
jgi:cyclohexanone monooxygenase